jgi:uncharacterized membrane protein YtjA (UPF0391 family)
MVNSALAFFILAIIAAVFGFGGIVAGAASVARMLFFVFLILFLATLIIGLVNSPRRTPM